MCAESSSTKMKTDIPGCLTCGHERKNSGENSFQKLI